MAEAKKKGQPRSFRFRPETLEGIIAAAEAKGMSVNAYMEQVASEALQQSALKGAQSAGGEGHVTMPEETTGRRLEHQSPSVEVSEGEAEAEGLTPEQLAGLLAAEQPAEPADTAMQEALRAAYAKADIDPPIDLGATETGAHHPVREVTANPLPASVTDQWMPDDPDVVMPGVPQQTPRPEARGSGAVFANDPLGLLSDEEEMPPAVEDEYDPHSVRPAGERWRPRAICDNGIHRRKVTQENLRRVVCGDCGTVISKW